jgi:hypothetical protein
LGAIPERPNHSLQSIGKQGRRHERICEPFPVMVRSVDASGEAFEVHTVLDKLSAADFSVRLERRVKPGTKLFAVVRLSTSAPEVPAPCVAVRSVVLRVVPQPDGTWGVTVGFTRFRFL